MPIVTQILCDGCRVVKKETNHWYTLTATEQGVCIHPLKLAAAGDPSQGVVRSQQYFCGRACTLEALSKWMDTLSHDV